MNRVWVDNAVKAAEMDKIIVGGEVNGLGRFNEVMVVNRNEVRLCCRSVVRPKIAVIFPPGVYTVNKKIKYVSEFGEVKKGMNIVEDSIWVYLWRGDERIKVVRHDKRYDCYATVEHVDLLDKGIRIFIDSNVPVEFIVEGDGKRIHKCVTYRKNTILVDKVCKSYKMDVSYGIGDKVWWIKVCDVGVQVKSYGCYRA